MAEQISMTQMEIPDYDLGLRGKLVRSSKTVGASDLAFCTIVYGLSLLDEVTETPFSNSENGYPDMRVTLDEDTRIELPWRRGRQAIIGDLTKPDGDLFEASPRAVLSDLTARYAALGLSPTLGYEYELWIFQDSGSSGPRGNLPVVPFGRTENAYSLTRMSEVDDLAQEFITRMDQIGITVETFHSELGPGFFEFTLAPAPALRAADNAARARQYLRDLCSERGLQASFMAKPFAGLSGAGGHVHSSLERDGSNIFAQSRGHLSALGANYVAGLVALMPDLALMFTPYVNSFKRIAPGMFVPERANWGSDDRSVACRVLLDTPASARVEHRRPGADANPYVVADALLAGGLEGIQRGLTLAPAGETRRSGADLPGSLGESLALFESSTTVADLLGKTFVQSYSATRHAELARYEQWARSTITDWELSRHLEHQ